MSSPSPAAFGLLIASLLIMMLKTFVRLLVVCFFIAPPAYGSDWDQILESLQRQGISRVGDLNIDQLKNEIQQNVQWKEIDKASRPLFAGNRRSAYYVIDEKTVYKSKDLPDNLKPIQSQLDLHEALGALGYQDQAYSLSTSLDIISRASNATSRSYLAETLGSTVFTEENLERLRSSGLAEGPGEGGGGDITAMLVKSAVLDKILAHRQINTREVLKHYAFINFEPQYNPKEQYVSLSYEFRHGSRNGRLLKGVPVDRQTGHQEKLSVWVPVLNWDRSNSARNQVIDEVAQHILELFPFQAVPNLPTQTYQICKNQSVTYVKPSSQNTHRIQLFRGLILGGCELGNFFGPQVSNIEIVTPAFDQNFRTHYDAPFYICSLRENDELVARYNINEIEPSMSDPVGEVLLPAGRLSDFNIFGIIKRNEKLEIFQFGFFEINGGSKIVAYNGRRQTVQLFKNRTKYTITCIRREM